MEHLLTKFAEHGVLGIVATLAMWALYKMFMRYESVQEKRVAEGLAYQEDARETQELAKKLTERVGYLTEKVHDLTSELRARG